MEDLPGNLEKALNHSQVPKPSKRKARWTLLFVEDHGRTVPVRMYKGIFLLVVIILISSLAAAAAFYFFYQDAGRENRRLVREINRQREQITTLKFDKDVVMTRLVVAEAKLRKAAPPVSGAETAPKGMLLSGETRPPAAPLPAVKPQPPEIPLTVKPQPAGNRPTGTTRPAEKTPKGENPPETEKPQETEKAPATAQPEEKQDESVPPAPPPRHVSIENLEVSHDAGSAVLQVNFLLRKVESETEIVSGHAFVILIPEAEDDRNAWISLPAAAIVDGKPAPTYRGQYFSISRFKPMKFEKAKIERPEHFSKARVVVFDTRGNLLMEEDYPLKIKEMDAG